MKKVFWKITKATIKFLVLFGIGGTFALFSTSVPINGIVLPIPVSFDGIETMSVLDRSPLEEVPRGLPFAWHAERVVHNPLIPSVGCHSLSCYSLSFVPFLLDIVFWTAVLYGVMYLARSHAKNLKYYRPIFVIVSVVVLVATAFMWTWMLFWAP